MPSSNLAARSLARSEREPLLLTSDSSPLANTSSDLTQLARVLYAVCCPAAPHRVRGCPPILHHGFPSSLLVVVALAGSGCRFSTRSHQNGERALPPLSRGAATDRRGLLPPALFLVFALNVASLVFAQFSAPRVVSFDPFVLPLSSLCDSYTTMQASSSTPSGLREVFIVGAVRPTASPARARHHPAATREGRS